MIGPEGGLGSSTETRTKGFASTIDAALPQTDPPVEATDWVKDVLQTLSVLREWFPAVFAGRPRPLKIGIHRDLVERASAVTPREIGRALGYHVRANAYLRAMRSGAPRYDLDGNAVGSVTEGEAANAKIVLDARAQRKAARLAATPPPAVTALQPTVSNRAIAKALGVSRETINKDVRGNKLPPGDLKSEGNGKGGGNKLPSGATGGRRDAAENSAPSARKGRGNRKGGAEKSAGAADGKRDRALEQALKDRELYRRSRGLGVRA